MESTPDIKGGLAMFLTKSEMQIMDVLWLAEKPMSRSDILESSPDKSWKDSSVHILLNGLLKKGIIQESGFVKRSKTYGRTFTPTKSREEYFAASIFSHKYQPKIVELIRSILQQKPASKDELAAIAELLDNMKKE